MTKTTKTLKAIVLSLGLVAMMMPANAMAQDDAERPGGLFGNKEWFSLDGLFTKDGEPEYDGLDNYNIGEEEAPLGSGIAILLAAGLGYVALKKKED